MFLLSKIGSMKGGKTKQKATCLVSIVFEQKAGKRGGCRENHAQC